MTGGTIRRSVIPVFPGFRRDKLGVSHPINRYRLVSFLFSAGCRQIYFLLNGSGFVWSKFIYNVPVFSIYAGMGVVQIDAGQAKREE